MRNTKGLHLTLPEVHKLFNLGIFWIEVNKNPAALVWLVESKGCLNLAQVMK